MEVVSTSNLVSSKNKTKQQKKQHTVAMISFVIPHDLMTGQMETYAYMQTSSQCSFMMAEL